MLRKLIQCCLLATVASTPTPLAPLAGKRQLATTPTVTLTQATVIGAGGQVDSFKGIPFAQPPVGDLRLRPPQSITKNLGTIKATGTPLACPQMPKNIDVQALPAAAQPVLTAAYADIPPGAQGEDCLTINVFRPTGTTANSNLPVLFWIYGGGKSSHDLG